MISLGGFAAALRDPDAAIPAGLKTWNGSDPAARFSVYRNNVMVSLIEALADCFPVTLQLVGDDFFRGMAREFALASPPRSPVMARYGEYFPAFVAAFRPAASVPYLADVARLEWARIRAFHAADSTPVDPAMLQSRLDSPEGVDSLGLALNPSVQWLPSPHPVVSLWAAHQQQEPELKDIDLTQPETALVLRDGLEVLTFCVEPGAGAFLSGLARSESLAQAAETALTHHPQFDLAAALLLLIRHSALTTSATAGHTRNA
jgi:hypothetical protein